MPILTHQPARYEVLIVGAGPVGLAAAWRLANKGHTVTVIERNRGLNAGGGDIQLSPNATLLLRKTGFAPFLETVVNPRQNVVVHDNDEDARVLLDIPLDLGALTPSLMVRRADVLEIFYQQAIASGVNVRFGCEVVAIGDDSEPSLTLSDGEVLTADLIIGADGVRSTTRSLIFPDVNTQPTALDQVCFHWTVPYSVMAEDSSTLAMWQEGTTSSAIVASSGSYLTYWSNDARKETYLIFTQTVYDKPLEMGKWNKPADLGEVRELFTDYPPAVRTLVQKCVGCEHWRIYDSVKGAEWVSPGGKVVLVGDAIHAMPPHMAQGLSQGLEDVVSLAEFIDAAASPTDFPRVVREFASFRQPRLDLIHQAARANANIFSLPPGAARDERNRKYAARQVDDKTTQEWKKKSAEDSIDSTNFNFSKWVRSYDVLKMTNAYIEQHLRPQ